MLHFDTYFFQLPSTETIPIYTQMHESACFPYSSPSPFKPQMRQPQLTPRLQLWERIIQFFTFVNRQVKKWYLFVILIQFLLITSEAEHLYLLCWSATGIFCSVNCVFCPFSIALFDKFTELYIIRKIALCQCIYRTFFLQFAFSSLHPYNVYFTQNSFQFYAIEVNFKFLAFGKFSIQIVFPLKL